MSLTASEFFKGWLDTSALIWPNPVDLASDYKHQTKPEWTERMDQLVRHAISSCLGADCEIQREFWKLDYAAWRVSGSRFHKPAYRQPLNVELVLEHENGGYCEEEFWKLLHFHSPLKVLVFYHWAFGSYEAALEDFLATKREFDRFHQRPASEEYLFINGDSGIPDFWRGTLLSGAEDRLVCL